MTWLMLCNSQDETTKRAKRLPNSRRNRSGVERADNSNHELVFYYADHAKQPEKALKVAQQEYAWRRDVYTLDAYAWALHVNGQDSEARKQIEAPWPWESVIPSFSCTPARSPCSHWGIEKPRNAIWKTRRRCAPAGSEQAQMRLASLEQAGLNR